MFEQNFIEKNFHYTFFTEDQLVAASEKWIYTWKQFILNLIRSNIMTMAWQEI